MPISHSYLNVRTSVEVPSSVAKQTLAESANAATRMTRGESHKHSAYRQSDGDMVRASPRNYFAEYAAELKTAMKELTADDKLSNFAIQQLMSAYNQAETLASSVRKKSDDTTNSQIGKI